MTTKQIQDWLDQQPRSTGEWQVWREGSAVCVYDTVTKRRLRFASVVEAARSIGMIGEDHQCSDCGNH